MVRVWKTGGRPYCAPVLSFRALNHSGSRGLVHNYDRGVARGKLRPGKCREARGKWGKRPPHALSVDYGVGPPDVSRSLCGPIPRHSPPEPQKQERRTLNETKRNTKFTQRTPNTRRHSRIPSRPFPTQQVTFPFSPTFFPTFCPTFFLSQIFPTFFGSDFFSRSSNEI